MHFTLWYAHCPGAPHSWETETPPLSSPSPLALRYVLPTHEHVEAANGNYREFISVYTNTRLLNPEMFLFVDPL